MTLACFLRFPEIDEDFPEIFPLIFPEILQSQEISGLLVSSDELGQNPMNARRTAMASCLQQEKDFSNDNDNSPPPTTTTTTSITTTAVMALLQPLAVVKWQLLVCY